MSLETTHQDFEELPKDMGAIGVMGRDGDTKHVWNPSDAAEVAEARLLFETLTAKGYRAYRMRWGGRTGEPIKTFDEVVGRRLLFSPPEPQPENPPASSVQEEPPHVLMVPAFQGG